MVTIGAAVALFAALFGFWWKLDAKIERLDAKLSGEVNSLDTKLSGEIKEVRQASEAAHKEIIGRLGGIETTQATHTERFNTLGARIDCIEDKIDNLNT
ncbi:MAG: hypothetical protein OXE52_09770 [Chloroflexi bacterium]|nr:hypothetical protein [Chloroflexota bacterium]